MRLNAVWQCVYIAGACLCYFCLVAFDLCLVPCFALLFFAFCFFSPFFFGGGAAVIPGSGNNEITK